MSQTSTSIANRSVRHPRLDHVHNLIEAGTCSAVAIDVFDALLWRRVGHPRELFDIVASRLRRDGRCPPWVTEAAFRNMRVEAENSLRDSHGELGAFSLFDIWSAMPLSIFDSAVVDDLVAAEVDVEREFTVADLDIAEIVGLADKHAIPILAVSDSHFTRSQLAHLLDRSELEPLRGCRILPFLRPETASQTWQNTFAEVGCEPEALIHIGDQERSNHTAPATPGVRKVYYTQTSGGLATVLQREENSASTYGQFGAQIDADHGDFGLTSLRGRASELAPDATTSAVKTAWRYGASVIGPVLTGFAEWVALRAHQCGIPVVWCPMREGKLLAQLINEAARARGWNVRAKPLWLSRQVASVAGLGSFDHATVHEFIGRSYRLTVSQLLTMLDLEPGDVPCLASALDTMLNHPRIVDRVSVALLESPRLVNHLAATTAAARQRLVHALRNSGALDDGELTLIDLGWGGTIQFHLARVLNMAQTDVTVSGLYLATNARITRVHRAGLRADGYLGQAGQPVELVQAASRSPEIIEQCTNALCGSLLDFTADGAPILSDYTPTTEQHAQRQAVQDGIVVFQQLWNRYVDERGDWPDLTAMARHRLANILTAALRNPTAQEAAVFGGWAHEDNFGSSASTHLLPDDLRASIPYLSPNDLSDLNMRDAFWPALIAASDPALSAATRALSAQVVGPELFDPSGPLYETRLRFRTTDQRWHDGMRRHVRINHNGLSFARLNFAARDTTHVSLAIPGRPAIVRIDWITAEVITNASSQPVVLRWETAADFAQLSYHECTWLGANIVQFSAPHAALWLPLAEQVGAPVTSARITIAFAMLPQSASRLEPQIRLAPAAEESVREADKTAERPQSSSRLRNVYRERGAIGVLAAATRFALRRLLGRR